ncbi:MAG: type II toxin-antitoxin system prevent-host-death family antitoxin [Acidobacteria bacterium]|nr:type II toxin-antitoxin system prevent-host-death family antitoxin [Acidobacteriota bacterium]
MSKFPSASRTSVGSADFKARCLELIDHVKESRAEYIVTRHGKPVARLVPVESEQQGSPLGSMKGTVLKYARPFDPVPATWSIENPDDGA